MEHKQASFTKAERLCSIRAIDELFASGKMLRLPFFRVIYSVMKNEPGLAPLRLLISVPKRHFKKAVMRNLLKRRIREAWRKNKLPLIKSLENKQRRLDVALIWSDINPADYTAIEESIIEIIDKLIHLR